MKKQNLLIVRVALLVLSVLFMVVFAPLAARAESNSHEFIVTLHAGEVGYFGDPSIKEKESMQYMGDTFVENTIPDTDDPTMVFVGWSTEPNATDVNVYSEMTSASVVGTDLYAVWTNECHVIYNVSSGYIEIGGRQVSSVDATYQKGSLFKVLEPVSNTPDTYLFDGWYSYMGGEGRKYEADTPITEPEIEVWSKWKFDAGRIEAMVLDIEYALDIVNRAKYLSFTPEETAVYEVSLMNVQSENGAFIQMMDVDNELLARSLNDYDRNAFITRELKAGTTYFFEFREMGAQPGEFVAKVSMADSFVVTFHANRDSQQDAWFDDDPTMTEKLVHFTYGEEISEYEANLILADYSVLGFLGWSTDPNATYEDIHPIYVSQDLDLYAVYLPLETIILDGNGGVFRLNGNVPQKVYSYVAGSVFNPTVDPWIDDNLVKFAGWSRDPDATEPDPDIIEGVTLADDLPDILYAVYTEKVTETFLGNGGYMLDDPSVTVYYSTKGKGHIFWGMVVHHEDPRMRAYAFQDQNGVLIPYTADIWPYYHVTEDTVYTTLWAYDLFFDANGGYWPWADNDFIGLWVPYEEPFSYQDLVDDIGDMVNPDPDKYFIGWASTPDATEPDIPDGEVTVGYLVENGIDTLYAVWRNDSYYFAEGENATWEKGSSEGLRFVVKREIDDSETYPAFTGVSVDGAQITTDSFDAEEGSVVLTLKPSYLEGLDAGEHELTVHFGNDEVSTTFTVTEPGSDTPPADDDTPKPADDRSQGGNQGGPQNGGRGNNVPTMGDGNDPLRSLAMIGIACVCMAGSVLIKKRSGKDRE